MASATQPEAAPSRPDRRVGCPRWLPAAAVVLAVAVAVKLVYGPWYLNYDARYALLWAGDLVHGATPDYGADFAPTPHPLSTAWSVLALPFGDSGDQMIVWLALLSFGVVVWLAYRLGAELFHPAVGLVTALTVLTRPALERDAILGYQDVTFGALVLGAVLLESRRPRRGAPVLGLLVLAGLLRPEAWVLGGLYWLYLLPSRSWRTRIGLGALVWLAPAVWVLGDLAVTGDALHSLHGTADLAAEANRRRRVDQVPFWTAKYFGYVLREPLLLGVPLGLLFAWRRRLRPALLPLAVAVAMVLVFAVNPLFGLPLIGRYVRTPSVLLALFYGLAVAGWLMLRADDCRRRRWQAVGAVALLASVVYLPWHVGLLSGLETRVDRNGTMYRQLRDIARDARVKASFVSCGGRITAADHRPIPYLRYWLHAGPYSVGTVEAGASPLSRVLLVPRRTREPRFFYKENFPRDVQPPASWTKVAQNGSWRVWADPTCASVQPNSSRSARSKPGSSGEPSRSSAVSSGVTSWLGY